MQKPDRSVSFLGGNGPVLIFTFPFENKSIFYCVAGLPHIFMVNFEMSFRTNFNTIQINYKITCIVYGTI